MSVDRQFPAGSDTVELLTDGESITAYCLVCEGRPVITSWTEFVTLNTVIKALYDHQDHVNQEKETPSARPV